MTYSSKGSLWLLSGEINYRSQEVEHEDSCKSPGLNLGGDGGAKIFADGSYVGYGRDNSTMTPKFLSINDRNARTTILGMAKTKGRKVVLCEGGVGWWD